MDLVVNTHTIARFKTTDGKDPCGPSPLLFVALFCLPPSILWWPRFLCTSMHAVKEPDEKENWLGIQRQDTLLEFPSCWNPGMNDTWVTNACIFLFFSMKYMCKWLFKCFLATRLTWAWKQKCHSNFPELSPSNLLNINYLMFILINKYFYLVLHQSRDILENINRTHLNMSIFTEVRNQLNIACMELNPGTCCCITMTALHL